MLSFAPPLLVRLPVRKVSTLKRVRGNEACTPVWLRRNASIVIASFAAQRATNEADGGLITVDVSVTDDLDHCHSSVMFVSEVQADAKCLVRQALHDESAELSIMLCSDEYIKALNFKWRGVEKPTDVLSFPQDDDSSSVLGDIVVSLHTAMRQAAERNHSIQTEIRILLVHGLLHLLGYDHETCEEDMQEVG
jgi:probable rRNA maturation factor